MSWKKKTIQAGLASALLASLAACGTSPAATPTATAAAITNKAPTVTAPVVGQAPNSAMSTVPAAIWTVVAGTYQVTLQTLNPDGSVNASQPATFVLNSQTFSGQIYPYATFSSAPASGTTGIGTTVSFQSYLNMAQTVANGEIVYGFVTTAQNLPNLAPGPIALELIVSVKPGANNSYSIDPSQSAIFVKDCGFSQTDCNVDSSDAAFAAVFGKS